MLSRWWAAAQLTCRNCPSYKHFPPTVTSVLFIEYTPNHLYYERGGDSSSLFCVHKSTFSLEQQLTAPVKLSSGSSFFFYNYGSWSIPTWRCKSLMRCSALPRSDFSAWFFSCKRWNWSLQEWNGGSKKTTYFGRLCIVVNKKSHHERIHPPRWIRQWEIENGKGQ